jgi:hypothetical protein
MTSTLPSTASGYVKGYAKGRRAALENVSPAKNPYKAGGPSFHGWNDGHYDAQSARRLEIDRHSALLWSRDGLN